MNIYYIRAAIEEKTGQRLSLEAIKDLLISENLVTKSKAKHLIFRGYHEFYDYFYKQDKNIIEAKTERAVPLDVVEELKESGVE